MSHNILMFGTLIDATNVAPFFPVVGVVVYETPPLAWLNLHPAPLHFATVSATVKLPVSSVLVATSLLAFKVYGVPALSMVRAENVAVPFTAATTSPASATVPALFVPIEMTTSSGVLTTAFVSGSKIWTLSGEPVLL